MAELNVKVGDKVLLSGGSPLNRVEEIREVIKVTPTGRIRISGSGSQFDKYGREMGSRDLWNSSYYIFVPTEEDIERVKKNNAIKKAVSLCGEVNKKNITYEQAEKLIEILEVKQNG